MMRWEGSRLRRRCLVISHCMSKLHLSLSSLSFFPFFETGFSYQNVTNSNFPCRIIHFTLFIFACIDTHRRRRNKTDVRANKIAQDIIAEMTQRGVLPAPQHQQQQPLPQQQYQPQPQQKYPTPAPDGTILPADASENGYHHHHPTTASASRDMPGNTASSVYPAGDDVV